MELAKYCYSVLKEKENFKLVFDTEARTLLFVIVIVVFFMT